MQPIAQLLLSNWQTIRTGIRSRSGHLFLAAGFTTHP
jgi:hypothetical protein